MQFRRALALEDLNAFNVGYKDYGFHARAFLKASAFSLAIIVPAGILISLLPGKPVGPVGR